MSLHRALAWTARVDSPWTGPSIRCCTREQLYARIAGCGVRSTTLRTWGASGVRRQSSGVTVISRRRSSLSVRMWGLLQMRKPDTPLPSMPSVPLLHDRRWFATSKPRHAAHPSCIRHRRFQGRALSCRHRCDCLHPVPIARCCRWRHRRPRSFLGWTRRTRCRLRSATCRSRSSTRTYVARRRPRPADALGSSRSPYL